jgi:hypothetical protein
MAKTAGYTDSWLRQNQVVWVSAPKNYTGAAATTEYVSFKNWERAVIKFQLGAWAAGTAAVTINQATDVSATGATALAFAYMYTNSAAVTAPTLVKTAVTASTFNLSVANSTFLIEIKADELDAGYDCLSVAVASPGANADFYGVEIIMSGPRYGGDVDALPVATTD